MHPFIYSDFNSAINQIASHLYFNGYPVKTGTWQAKENPPEFHEVLNTSFSVYIPPKRDQWVKQIKPNIPWADDHFNERVGGEPLNPGEQYKNWPWYKNNPSNDIHRTAKGRFSHTYMERIWCKQAGEGLAVPEDWMFGIRYNYGDFMDLVRLMAKDPYTRQAFLPIWFPEDTGAVSDQRVPCTLGYHFILREERMHVVYYIRSCDFFRHFRDDIYLCLRKVEWLLEQLRVLDGFWKDIQYGTFTMHITSLHIFAKERNLLIL